MIRTSADYKSYSRPNLKGGDGEVFVTEYMLADDMINCRLLCEQVLPIGASIGLHTHVKETEFYIITQGKGLVKEDHSESEVGVGDVVVTTDGESHSIYNIGDEELRMTAIIVTF